MRDEESAIAEAMYKLASDTAKAEEMGRKGREAIEARHSWEHRASSLVNVLDAST